MFDSHAVLIEESMKLRKQIEQLQIENTCDICCGDGEPVSGKPCLCKGTGKMSEVAHSLRHLLYDTNKKLERLEKVIHLCAQITEVSC